MHIYLIVLAPFFEKIILFSIDLCWQKSTMNEILSSQFFSVDLHVYLCVGTPLLVTATYSKFLSQMVFILQLLFFSKAILTFLNFCINFRIGLSVSTKKKACWKLDCECIKFVDQFGKNCHLDNISVPIHAYEMCFHLFRSPLIYFSFKCTSSACPLLSLFLSFYSL